MKSIDRWLDEYGESHRNPVNKAIHWICVPLIVFSLVGMLWSIPHAYFAGILPPPLAPFLNWGTLFLMVVICYYTLLSRVIFLCMIPVVAVVSVGNYLISDLTVPHWLISLTIFVAAWIGQFIGHKIEGKKPSFFKDLQFLLISPAWLLSFVLQRMGIAYSEETRRTV